MKLILEGIKKSFGSKNVLTDISFSFEKGKIYGLLGRNGAGKTTLFNCLSDEIDEDAGKAYIIDNNGIKRELDSADIGYVFSTPVLPDFLTGYEFVKFFMDIHKDRLDEGKTADDFFDIVKIEKEDRGRLLKGYSHGMKNKVQMLCFIIAKPPVILLDEPLTSFDVIVALEIKKLLREMKEEHILIFSTHILQLATDLCDEIVAIHDGKLSLIDSEMLQSKDFEEQLVEILKDVEAHG